MCLRSVILPPHASLLRSVVLPSGYVIFSFHFYPPPQKPRRPPPWPHPSAPTVAPHLATASICSSLHHSAALRRPPTVAPDLAATSIFSSLHPRRRSSARLPRPPSARRLLPLCTPPPLPSSIPCRNLPDLLTTPMCPINPTLTRRSHPPPPPSHRRGRAAPEPQLPHLSPPLITIPAACAQKPLEPSSATLRSILLQH
jgi:hypothetical protein